MKSNIREIVKSILEAQPDARDYDEVLLLALISKYGYDYKTVKFLDVIRDMYNRKLPTFESITRARRKCQEEFPELRGTKETQQAREQEQETYRQVYRR